MRNGRKKHLREEACKRNSLYDRQVECLGQGKEASAAGERRSCSHDGWTIRARERVVGCFSQDELSTTRSAKVVAGGSLTW